MDARDDGKRGGRPPKDKVQTDVVVGSPLHAALEQAQAKLEAEDPALKRVPTKGARAKGGRSTVASSPVVYRLLELGVKALAEGERTSTTALRALPEVNVTIAPVIEDVAEVIAGVYASWRAEHERKHPAMTPDELAAWEEEAAGGDWFAAPPTPPPYVNPLERSTLDPKLVGLVEGHLRLIERVSSAEVDRLEALRAASEVPQLPRSWDEMEAWCEGPYAPPWGAWYHLAISAGVAPRDLERVGDSFHRDHPLNTSLPAEWVPMLHFVVWGRAFLKAAKRNGWT